MTGKPAHPRPIDKESMISRFREAGEVTLDLVHRDGRVAGQWLGLHPREFELFWRLAEQPGVVVSKQVLLLEVWRLEFEPPTNSLAVHVARIRSKLSRFELEHTLKTDRAGGYFVDVPERRQEIDLEPQRKR